MKFLPFVSMLFPALVAAQEWGSPAPVVQPPSSNNNAVAAVSSSNSTSTGHLVTLGQGDAITFTPNTLTVNAGDTITFVIATASESPHGVVESSANAPCTQLQGGFDSGLVNPGGNFSVVVNSTNPIYLFCPQFNPFDHCMESGMVMIINPPSSSAINSFESAATAVASEAVATAPVPVGVAIASTSVSIFPSSASSSSSGASTSGASSSGSSPSPSPTTTSGALRNIVGTSAALLTAGLALFLA